VTGEAEVPEPVAEETGTSTDDVAPEVE